MARRRRKLGFQPHGYMWWSQMENRVGNSSEYPKGVNLDSIGSCRRGEQVLCACRLCDQLPSPRQSCERKDALFQFGGSPTSVTLLQCPERSWRKNGWFPKSALHRRWREIPCNFHHCRLVNRQRAKCSFRIINVSPDKWQIHRREIGLWCSGNSMPSGHIGFAFGTV